jgi:hypothetical protein
LHAVDCNWCGSHVAPESGCDLSPRATLPAWTLGFNKTVRLMFEPEPKNPAGWMPLMVIALQREFDRLFNQAGIVQVEEEPEIAIVVLWQVLKFRFELPNVRTAPFDFVDVELTGRAQHST